MSKSSKTRFVVVRDRVASQKKGKDMYAILDTKTNKYVETEIGSAAEARETAREKNGSEYDGTWEVNGRVYPVNRPKRGKLVVLAR